MIVKARKKLIEVALPLDAINAASAREKSIRHGHPSTLHLWWARRPLAAARAVIFAQMVDDPSSFPDLFPTEKAQEKERARLFRIIEELVKWENTTNEAVLQKARDEIWQSWRRACADNAGHPRANELFDRHKLPAFHDPFAGGGALPLEAQRLGLEAYASDLNPVAVLINKAMIEIPPKFAGKPPVNPVSRASSPLFAKTSRDHAGWRSRGYLPHFDSPGAIQHILFRLADALPAAAMAALEREPPARRMEAVAAALREARGDALLGSEKIAAIVERALLHFDSERYRLLAWCVMPTHVHVLAEQIEGHPLSAIVHSWKSFSASEANKALGRSGAFWAPEYFVRFMRDEAQLETTRAYIEANPVTARLCSAPDQWRFSSAWRGAREETRDGTRASSAQRNDTDAMRAGGPRYAGAQGLAEDVRYYGRWMRDEAEKRIGHLYPKIAITAEMAKERPDLKPLVGQKLTVIAWLWARTVKSPNPAYAHVDVPLVSTFTLSTKPGKEAYVEPVIEGGSYRFTVKVGKPKDAEAAKKGTKLARGANFRCVMSESPVSGDYIKAEGKAGRMGARLMAIVAEGARGRVYLSPTPEHEAAACQAKPEWRPETPLAPDPRALWTPPYGLTTFGDLFTPRQLVALTTFSDLVGEARERVRADALAAGLPDDGKPLREGGLGATAYAEAVAVYLGMTVSRLGNRGCTISFWDNTSQKIQQAFGRQALPMTWDFCESNPFSESTGNWLGQLDFPAKVVAAAAQADAAAGFSHQQDAQTQQLSTDKVVSTDPPYYANIGYADLSDFFYVWLRRSLRPILPELFGTLAVPKAEELVATPYRHGSKEKAESFFLAGMTQAMHRLAEQAHPAFPVTIYYAFKQSETESAEGTASTGWETFLDAVIRAGFSVSGTWPVRTELTGNLKKNVAALASSIVLVCRPRDAAAPTATRREFAAALKAELPAALRHLQAGNIAPVDLAQAAIGPGMAVYTRCAKVLDAEGKPVSVREALALINEVLDEALAEQEGDFDADSRWALAWFEQVGFADGEYGVAETLSKAKNTSVAGLVEAGILASARGRVRLLKPEELPPNWDPATDPRLTAWEMVHHLIRVLGSGGEAAAADLVAKLGTRAETARELAYRLYTICERKKRAAEALAYNGLVQSWPEIARLARDTQGQAPAQGMLL